MIKTLFLAGRFSELGTCLLLSGTLCIQASGQEEAEPRAGSERNDLRVACFVESNNQAAPDTVRAALESWTSAITPDHKRKIYTKIESNSSRWFEAITRGDHDLYGLFSYQYLELEDPSLLRPSFAIVSDHGPLSTFLLLTRKEDKIENISQLREKRITVDTGGHGQLPLIWLATQIGTDIPAAKIRDFASIVPVERPHRALFPVYFGKSDACIISRGAFAAATALNPDITRKLQVTTNSKPLLVSLFAFHRDYPLVPAEKLTSNANDANDSRASRTFFNLTEREGVQPFDESLLTNVTDLYREYKALFAPPVSAASAMEGPME